MFHFVRLGLGLCKSISVLPAASYRALLLVGARGRLRGFGGRRPLSFLFCLPVLLSITRPNVCTLAMALHPHGSTRYHLQIFPARQTSPTASCWGATQPLWVSLCLSIHSHGLNKTRGLVKELEHPDKGAWARPWPHRGS